MVNENYISIEDLKEDYNNISAKCKENNQAFILTVNGEKDTVFISFQEYNIMKARLELLETLSEAEIDEKNNNLISEEDVKTNIKNMLSNMKNDKI